MKTNIVLFWIIAIFFLVVSTMYTVWNLIVHDGRMEWVGSVVLLLSGMLAGFIAFYLGLVSRKQGGTLPADIEHADIDDGDPELGEFSPWSWWPLVLASGASMVLLGIALQWGSFWLVIFAVPVLIVGVVGWVYEYYRGLFAR
ncbi:MAG: cytochrome c oxidase subunit 4 [Leucobacter sp.]